MLPSQPSAPQRALFERLGFTSIETEDSSRAVWCGVDLAPGLEVTTNAAWSPVDDIDGGTAEQQVMRVIIRETMRHTRRLTREKFEAIWRE